MIRKIIRMAVSAVGIAAAAVITAVIWLDSSLPDSFYVSDPASFSLSRYQMLSVERENIMQVSRGDTALSSPAELKLGGVIPVKTVGLQQTEKRYLVPCGTPFGLKMTTDGVLVVGLSPVESSAGTVCPAQTAGLRKGDIITAVNGEELNSFEQLSDEVTSSDGRMVELMVSREGRELSFSMKPVRSVSGEFQCGIWGRDSSAGIGTVTFYDPVTGKFGGLGHGVCDADTGMLMPLAEGEILPAVILDVVAGTAGTPGELQGSFSGGFSTGTMLKNTLCGVFGLMRTAPSDADAAEICLKQDVKAGPAEILATVKGQTPARYDIMIEKVSYSDLPARNLVIRVTDPDLLAETGGIVQGMSGSPIIQNNRLVGAVTHVLVNDPTKGYGIFIENMLDAAG